LLLLIIHAGQITGEAAQLTANLKMQKTRAEGTGFAKDDPRILSVALAL
jgi:hypothetical protein